MAHLVTAAGQRHFFFVGWILSQKVSSDRLLRFSARFSLMDLPLFLDMLCRGDLSLMGLSLRGSLNGSVSRQYPPLARGSGSSAMGAAGQRTLPRVLERLLRLRPIAPSALTADERSQACSHGRTWLAPMPVRVLDRFGLPGEGDA